MKQPDSFYSGTQPVAPTQRFDEARLGTWMMANVPGFSPPLLVEQFRGGQSNPTFLLRAGAEAGSNAGPEVKRYVLRRKPMGELLPSAHAVDREFRVMRALGDSEVPVPGMHALCEDASVIGSAFYVMDHVEGRVFWDPTLPRVSREQRTAIYDELVRVLAALHCVEPEAVGLGDYGRSGAYLERQVSRWSSQYKASETEPIEAADRLIEWLPKHMPAQGETRIVHGDYRIDNVIFHPSEPRILAVLDWELSTLGDPLVDFAYFCMAWHMDPRNRGLGNADLRSLGIPDEASVLGRYLRLTGRTRGVSARDWNYYLVFNLFRFASIMQGVLKRALQGNASNATAVETGKRARPLAEQAWALAQSMERDH